MLPVNLKSNQKECDLIETLAVFNQNLISCINILKRKSLLFIIILCFTFLAQLLLEGFFLFRFNNFIDHLRFFFTFLYANRRSIAISSIGLIIALGTITQSIIYLNTVDGQLFSESINDLGYEDHHDIEIIVNKLTGSGNLPPRMINIQEEYLFQSLSKFDLESYYKFSKWWTEYFVQGFVNESISLINSAFGDSEAIGDNHLFYVGFPDNIFSDLESLMDSGSRLPSNENEVILLKPKGAPLSKEMVPGRNLTIQSGSSPGVNESVLVSGIINYDFRNREENISALFDKITGNSETLVSHWINYTLMTKDSYWRSTIEKIKEQKNGYYPLYTIIGRVFLDHSKFSIFNLDKETYRLEQFFADLDETFDINNLYSATVLFPLIPLVHMIQFDADFVLIYLILFTFPVVILSLFLSIYGFGLVKYQKKFIISLFRTRGLSNKYMFIMLFLEAIFEILLSILVGIIFGIIFGFIVLNFDSITNLTENNYPLVIDWSNLISILLIFGFFFGIILRIKSIIKFSNLDPVQMEDPFENSNGSFWHNYYIDILFIILGIISYYIMLYSSGTIDLSQNAFIFIIIIGLPSPVFLIIGISLLITRIFPVVFNSLAKILWFVQNGLMSITWKNMLRHQQAIVRSIIILVLAFSMGIISVTIPPSINNHILEQGYYDNGGDIYFSVNSFLSEPELEDIKADSGNLDSLTPIVEQEYNSYYSGHKLLGIDPQSYSNVAFHKSIYTNGKSLQELVESLEKAPNSILMRKEDADRLGKKTGDNLFLKRVQSVGFYSMVDQTSYLNVTLTGTFDYWPRLVNVPSFDSLNSKKIYLVTTIDFIESISNFYEITNDHYGYIGKIHNMANISGTMNLINARLGREVTRSALNSYETKIHSPSWKIFLGLINSTLLISILVYIFGQLFFMARIIIERTKEFSIDRAIGMTTFQGIKTIFFESFVVIIFSILVGLVLGGLMANIFMFFLTIQTPIPPFEVLYQYEIYLIFIFSSLLLITLLSILTAILISKRKLNQVLRGNIA